MVDRDTRPENYHTKTNLKELYFLSEDELSQIKYIDCRNPHSKYSRMKLYHKDDVFEFLKDKYKTSSLDILNSYIEETRKAKEDKKEKRLTNKSFD